MYDISCHIQKGDLTFETFGEKKTEPIFFFDILLLAKKFKKDIRLSE